MKFIRYIVFLLITAVCITFALSNRQSVSLDFFPLAYAADMPIFLVIFLSFMGGIIVGGFSSLTNILKLRRSQKATRKQVNKLEKTLSTLKEKTEDNLVL